MYYYYFLLQFVRTFQSVLDSEAHVTLSLQTYIFCGMQSFYMIKVIHVHTFYKYNGLYSIRNFFKEGCYLGKFTAK